MRKKPQKSPLAGGQKATNAPAGARRKNAETAEIRSFLLIFENLFGMRTGHKAWRSILPQKKTAEGWSVLLWKQ
jgi:hypothetical protein